MNFYERTFVAMVRTCLTYMQKNESQWRSVPVLVELYNRLVELDADIVHYEQMQQVTSTKAEIAQRQQDSEQLAKNFYKLSRRLLLFAKNTNNATLAQQCYISEPQLKAKNANNLIITCVSLLEMGRQHQDQASKYQINEAELKDLEKSLENFKALPKELLHVGNESRRATRELKATLIEVRNILQKIDFGIDGMIADENFINGWADVRRIKSRPIAKKKDKMDPLVDENNE